MTLEGNGTDGWEDIFDDEDQNQDEAKNNESSNDLFLRLKPRGEEDPYRLRLVAKPVKFRKHFEAFKLFPEKKYRYPISPAVKIDEKGKDISWAKGKYAPSKRFAAVFINRESNQVQIVEAGPQVFNAIKNYFKVVKKNPASAESAPDWLVTVKKDKTGQVEYTCQPDPEKGPNALTDEEKKEVEDFFDRMVKVSRDKYDNDLGWKTFYKPLSSEKIEELWNQLPEDRKVKKFKEDKEKEEKNEGKDKGKKDEEEDEDHLPGLEPEEPKKEEAPAEPAESNAGDDEEPDENTFF